MDIQYNRLTIVPWASGRAEKQHATQRTDRSEKQQSSDNIGQTNDMTDKRLDRQTIGKLNNKTDKR